MSLVSKLTDAAGQARTLTALATLNAGLLSGVGAGRLTGDTRRGRNLACGPSFDVGLALAGVRIAVTGSEHLRAPRPAIFAFNHQSNLDPLVVIKLVRHDFTSTGKAEVRQDPLARWMAVALDAILIERSDPEQARLQMAEAANRLKQGTSMLIAPEGTRNPGPEPGPYRTGVIHLALDTGVPVVPVVLRNTGVLMPKRVIHPGTVEAVVLPPLDPAGWERATARQHAAELRDLMVAQL